MKPRPSEIEAIEMTETDRRMWTGWIELVTRYSNSNLLEVVVKEGFPVDIGSLEPEYYFAHSSDVIEDAGVLLEENQWVHFIRLCRTIRNGTIRSLKIRASKNS